MSEANGEEVKLNPVEKMRIRVAAENYKSMDESVDNNDKDQLVEEKKCEKSNSNTEESSTPCSSLEQVMAFMLFIALSAVIVLVILLVLKGFDRTFSPKHCNTPACVEISGALIKNMDLTAQPCDNFYQYACGSFGKDHIIPPDEKKYGWFSFITRNVNIDTKRLLEETGTLYEGKHSSAIEKAKLYFDVCMDITALQKMGIAPFLMWLRDIGSWTVSYTNTTGMWSLQTFNLEQSMANLVAYDMDSFFYFGISRDEMNTSLNILKFDQGDLTFSDYSMYLGNNSKKYEKIYTDYIISFIKALGGNPSKAETVATELWNLETQIAQISDSADFRVDVNNLYNKMTVQQLQNILDPTLKYFDLLVFLKHVFNERVPSSEDVIVASPNYFSKLGKVLNSTSNETLAHFLALKAAERVVYYQPKELQAPKIKLHANLLGVSAHPHWYGCITSTIFALRDAVGALYVQKFFTSEKMKMSGNLALEIVDIFKSHIPKVTWMDKITMENALKKVNAVSYKIGYPLYITNVKKLDSTYEQLNITNTTAFENFKQALLFNANRSLSKRGQPSNPLEWDMSPTTVNAYYSRALNQMVFPAGIFNRPFFDPSYPMAMNYGSIGFTMGHELTHGFDNKGRNYDKHGNLKNWWSNSSAQHFTEKSKCLVDQYSKFKVGDRHINGLSTLGENIADNGGVKTSYNAYQSWLKSHGNKERDAILPGLNTTERQLFFLAYAQTWCTYYTPQYALQSVATDVHSFAKYRVIGPLSNMKEFADAYDCNVNSPMNPKKKCTVW